MPLYRYKCEQCDNVFEELKDVEERKNAYCECGGDTKQLIGSFNRGFVLEPQYFEHLDTEPVWIENKQHLKQECEKRGVEAKCLYD